MNAIRNFVWCVALAATAVVFFVGVYVFFTVGYVAGIVIGAISYVMIESIKPGRGPW